MHIEYDISVLVLTYYPQKEQLIKTLKSILLQENVRFQIVISDDGSEDNLFVCVKELMEQYSFTDYILVGNMQNKGTVYNCYYGLQHAKGKYVKTISPGDFLYSEHVLAEWFQYMEKNGIQCSFGDAVYYQNTDGCMMPFRKKYGYPRLPQIYDFNKYRQMTVLINCFVLEDYILGAAYLCLTELFLQHLNNILGRVKFLEDGAYRLMLINDQRSIYYPHPVVIYEYGTGVSTSDSDIWKLRVKEDLGAIDQIAIENYVNKKFTWRFSQYVRFGKNKGIIKKNIVLLLLFPTALFWKIHKRKLIKNNKCRTSDVIDKSFFCSLEEG